MSFLLSWVSFLGFALAAFAVPGIIIYEYLAPDTEGWEKFWLGAVLGFLAFTLAYYLLFLVRLEFLLIPAILILNLIFVPKIIKRLKLGLPSKKRVLLIAVVFVIGVAGQMAVIAPSGRNLEGNLVFWSSHGHDGSWHIALMEALSQGPPLQNPVFAGEKLVNYHFFSDVAPTFFYKYLGFDGLDLYFRYFPLIFSILLGTTAYILGKKMGGNFLSGIWSSIFVFFAGSFGYIATLYLQRGIGGESLFWASQVQSSIGNPPQIVSNFLLLAFLILFILYLKKKSFYLFLVCTIIVASLSVFKVYAAVVVLASIALAGLWQGLREKKFDILLLFLASSSLSLLLYLPNTKGSTSFLILEPWWYIRTMIVEPSRLNWLDHELRRQTYVFEGNVKRVVFLEAVAFSIFFFGNLGTRFLGLFEIPKLIKKSLKDYFGLVFLAIIFFSLLFPLLFLQQGVASNTAQFLQYFILPFGLLSGVFVAKVVRSIKPFWLKLIFSLVIIAFSVPTQVALLWDFYKRPAFARISQKELSALSFLKQTIGPEDAILTPPHDKDLDLREKTPNIWDWADTSYVSAFSARKTFLSDVEQVDIMGYDYQKRLAAQRTFFAETDPEKVKEILLYFNLKYIYFPKPLKPAIDLYKINLQKIYQNSEVEIWASQPL